LEHATVHGHHYGTLLKPIVEHLMNGRDVLIDIDTQGAATIRSSKDKFIRDALADVFIMPPDVEELRRRLTKPQFAKWNRGRNIATPSLVERLRKICRNFDTL